MEKRKMPTKKQIKDHWKDKIVEIKNNIFPSVEKLYEGDYCFACGLLTNNHTERAHIMARSIGGSDTVDNIHLLCKACHKDSEILDGVRYDEWFKKRTLADTIVTITYTIDYEFCRNLYNLAEDASIDLRSVEFLDYFNGIRKAFHNNAESSLIDRMIKNPIRVRKPDPIVPPIIVVPKPITMNKKRVQLTMELF